MIEIYRIVFNGILDTYMFLGQLMYFIAPMLIMFALAILMSVRIWGNIEDLVIIFKALFKKEK